MEKQLGKISNVRFGFGGYQDAQFGLSLTFEFDGSGCFTFEGFWAHRSDHAKWSVDDQKEAFADTMIKLRDLLSKAKVDDISKLQGIPIEAEFEKMQLKSWRILTEVL